MVAGIKLKTALVFGTSAVIMANLIGFMVAFYLNAGIKSTYASAAGITLQVTDMNIPDRQFTVTDLAGDISAFQPGKTILVYKGNESASAVNINNNNSETTEDKGGWEFTVISSVTGSAPYIITVSSLINNYTDDEIVRLMSVPENADHD